MPAADHQAPNNDREQTSPDNCDYRNMLLLLLLGKARLKRKVNLEQ